MSSSLTPVITDTGITALIDARNNGLTARITQVAVGDGGDAGTPYTATADMTALRNEIQRVIVSGGERIGHLQNQLHLTATVQDEGRDVPKVYPIYEIGFFLETGELLAVYASPDEKLAEKVTGTDFMLAFDLTFTGADAGNIVIDGSGQLATPAARDNMLLGLNTVKIHTQAEFDRIFNQGDDTVIPANTTITLSPIQGTGADIANGASGGTGDNPENTCNGRPAYILKNSLVLSQNVHIIGFNQEDTLVVKDAAETKIKLQGATGAPVTGVRLRGWSFDGRGGLDGLGGNLTGTTDGGAFSLDHCEQCDLNCKIINHHTSADGGGLFGGNEVRYITATQVHYNRAANGGGAANCHNSTLNVYDCSATANGSGTFNCDNAMLRLFNCQASQGNGVFVNDNNDLTVSGNLGIGTASPSQKLHVEGDAVLGSSGQALRMGHVGHSGFAGIAHEDCADRNSYALIQRSSGTTLLNTASGQNLHLRQGNSDRVVIGTNGNVGIGTASPAAKLDVHGDIHIDGSKPFMIRRFNNVNANRDTGVSHSTFSAAIISFVSSSGDINEKGSGRIMQMQLHKSGNTWRISADFRTHSRSETWSVWVMFINKHLVDESGF